MSYGPDPIQAARLRKPIKVIITEDGHGPKGSGGWGSFKCPFCEHKTAAGVFAAAGTDLFKCHHNPCPTDNKALDEVGYLALRLNLNRTEAFVAYLKQAGVYREERLSPSILPGARARRGRRPALPQSAISSPSGIFPEADHPQPEAESTPEATGGGAESGASNASSPDGRDPLPDPQAPPPPVSPNTVVRAEEFPEYHDHLKKVLEVAATDGAAATGGSEEEVASPATSARVLVTTDEVLEARRWFFNRLNWSEAEVMATVSKRGLSPQTQRVFGLRSNRFENLTALQEMHVPGSARFPVEVLLRAGLWERPGFNGDEGDRFARRFPEGHVPAVVDGCHPCRAFFGYSFLGTVRGSDGMKRPKYDWVCHPIIPYFDWLPAAETPLHEWVGVTEGEFKAMAWWQMFARDVHRMPDPSPDKLVTLHPHKHWGRGERPSTFLTPPGGGKIQHRGRWLQFGCAALPGISHAKKRGSTWATRHELDEFLRLGQSEFVAVVYDNEEKGDPALPKYNPNVEERFDSSAWGLFLARDLSRERTAYYGELPDGWRDQGGKADWDGVLAGMVEIKRPEAVGGTGEGANA